MLKSYNKAIAALVAPVVSLLVLAGFVPEDFATTEVIAGLTSVVTSVAVFFIPND